MVENEVFDLLIRMTVASSAAILLVLVLRRQVRKLWGASNAYLLWLLIPAAMLTAIMPAPTIILPSEPAPTIEVSDHVILDEMHRETVPHSLAGDIALQEPSASETIISTADKAVPADPSLLEQLLDLAVIFPWMSALAITWAIGAFISLAVLVYRQYRFMKALGVLEEEQGNVFVTALRGFGPALVGAFRPRLIVPADFRDSYTMEEQALILAHERRHLARGDAQANTLVALLKCVFWFNPLFAFAIKRFHIDQEVACDADVLRDRDGEQGAYAKALLKAQLAAHGIPLGCAWPAGSGHPLRERIAAFGGKGGPVHKRANAAVLIAAIGGMSVAAWSFQPPAYVTSTADDMPVRTATVETNAEPDNQIQTEPTPAPAPEASAEPQVSYGVAVRADTPVVPLARVTDGKFAVGAPTVRPGLTASAVGAPKYRVGNRNAVIAPDTNIDHHDVEWKPDGESYIDSLKAAGLDNLDVETIIALKVQNVNAGDIAALKDNGFPVDPEILVAFKVHDVTTEYIRDLRGVWPNVSAEEIMAMKVQGVKASDAEGFKDIGFSKLTAEEAVAFKVMGVTPDYIRRMQTAGVTKHDPEHYIAAKSMGVTPDYIKHLKDRGFTDLTLDKVIQLKSVGVD